jgi:hypothetical protein
MSGPSKPASASPGQPETVLVRVERLRQQTAAFLRDIEEALQTARVDELRVRDAKRRVLEDEGTDAERRLDMTVLSHG